MSKREIDRSVGRGRKPSPRNLQCLFAAAVPAVGFGISDDASRAAPPVLAPGPTTCPAGLSADAPKAGDAPLCTHGPDPADIFDLATRGARPGPFRRGHFSPDDKSVSPNTNFCAGDGQSGHRIHFFYAYREGSVYGQVVAALRSAGYDGDSDDNGVADLSEGGGRIYASFIDGITYDYCGQGNVEGDDDTDPLNNRLRACGRRSHARRSGGRIRGLLGPTGPSGYLATHWSTADSVFLTVPEPAEKDPLRESDRTTLNPHGRAGKGGELP